MFWRDKSDYITPVLGIPCDFLPHPESQNPNISRQVKVRLPSSLIASSFPPLVCCYPCWPPGCSVNAPRQGLYSYCFLCLGCCPQMPHGSHFLPWSSLLQRHLLSETSFAILFQVAAPLLSFFIFLWSLYPQLIFYTCH